MSKSITYNSYNLQSSSIVMTELDFQTIDKDLNTGRLATTDINKFIESYVGNKKITYRGYIKGTDADNAEALLDTLKQNVLLNQVANLDIEYASGTRRYRCVGQSVKVTNETPALDVKYIEIVFETIEPLGLATTAETITYTGETVASIIKSATLTGSYATLPKYTITVTSESNMTALRVTSSSTNQAIVIQKSFNISDVIVIDTKAKTVTYNGADSDYFGIFPTVKQGFNTFLFNVTSSSHNLNIQIEYVPRYL